MADAQTPQARAEAPQGQPEAAQAHAEAAQARAQTAQRTPRGGTDLGGPHVLEQPGELPRRPRRRLLAPVPLALLGVLALACGFIGGVLVEKGQTGSGGATGFSAASAPARGGTASAAERFGGFAGAGAARTGATTGSGAAAATGTGSAATGTGSAAGAAGTGALGAGAGGGVTSGEVTYVRGGTMYVKDSEGNTVEVKAGSGSTVTKTVTTKVQQIHPGETVVVRGDQGSSGTIQASSITVGSAASGFGSLFATGGRSGSSSAGKSSAAGKEPALFGP